MTVNTIDITSGPYDGNDVTDTFDYEFRVDSNTQIAVYERVGTGVPTLLTLTTDYTVAGVGDDDGGVITRVAGALPSGSKWYIRSNYAETQLTAFGSQGGFFPDVHEKAMDKITFLLQQIKDITERSIKLAIFDESAETADMTIPDLETRISQYLGFDASGNLITIAGVASEVIVSSFMETLLDDNDVETAHGTLGLSKGTDVASAGTLILGTGSYFDVTGTNAITAIGSKGDNAPVILQFDGILTLTHHVTNLILPTGANITTAAGDHAILKEYDAGKWRCVGYFRIDGAPLPGTTLISPTLTNVAGMTLQGSAWPSFSVHCDGSHPSIPDSTFTKMEFSAEDFDTNNNFDSVTNYRFTPTVAGKYLLTATVVLGGVAVGDLGLIRIYKNGTGVKEGRDLLAVASSSFGLNVDVIADANGTTDYFEVYVYHDAGSSQAVNSVSYATHFHGSRIA